jgi:uncharacterized coiled-coil DUF342 family protein
MLETQLAATEEMANLQQQVIVELQRQLSQKQSSVQQTSQIILQHTYQELQAECSGHVARLTQLEPQVIAMQEQILQQDRQVRECETAVQYWKDKYFAILHQMFQLKEALKQHSQGSIPEFSDPLVEIQDLANEATDAVVPELIPSSPLKHRPLRVDLPDFLTRRRRQFQ